MKATWIQIVLVAALAHLLTGHEEEVHFKWIHPNPTDIELLAAEYVNASYKWEQRRQKFHFSRLDEDRIAAADAKAQYNIVLEKMKNISDADAKELARVWLYTRRDAVINQLHRFFQDTGTKKEVVLDEVRKAIPEIEKDKDKNVRIYSLLGYLLQHGTVEDYKIILYFQDDIIPGVSGHARHLTNKYNLDGRDPNRPIGSPPLREDTRSDIGEIDRPVVDPTYIEDADAKIDGHRNLADHSTEQGNATADKVQNAQRTASAPKYRTITVVITIFVVFAWWMIARRFNIKHRIK